MNKDFYNKLDLDLLDVINKFYFNKVSESVLNVSEHLYMVGLDVNLLKNMGSEIDKENENK